MSWRGRFSTASLIMWRALKRAGAGRARAGGFFARQEKGTQEGVNERSRYVMIVRRRMADPDRRLVSHAEARERIARVAQ